MESRPAEIEKTAIVAQIVMQSVPSEMKKLGYEMRARPGCLF